jgi:hypothetical protein
VRNPVASTFAVVDAVAALALPHVQLESITDRWTSGAEREASDRVWADVFEAAPILGAARR